MATEISDSLAYLYALQRRGMRPGLERIQQLVAYLNDPQQYYPIIHVAGTNGKGTTCALISAVFAQAGLRVGLYTSPHLVRFNERIRISGTPIDNRAIKSFLNLHRAVIDKSKATFFEATTALALDYFARQQVDIAVLEVGLGGRFDATNIVRPQLTIITALARDHEQYLGHTLKTIAFEKAGIIKQNKPVVVGEYDPRTAEIFREKEFLVILDLHCISSGIFYTFSLMKSFF